VGIFLILNRSFSFRSFEGFKLATRDCTHATISWNGTMLRCCFSILLLLGLVVRQGQCQLSLATTFNGPNGDIYADGDKFAILTMNTPISIQRFDIHMANVTKQVAIWTKSSFPFWNDTTSWTKQWEGEVTGQGQGVSTPLPAMSAPIQVSANTTLGLYISVKEYNTSYMYHSTGVAQKSIFASDEYIRIAEGLSQGYIHMKYRQPTRWNGESSIVWYQRSLSLHALAESFFSKVCCITQYPAQLHLRHPW
jgi:hypothetical protein